jgi:hypothetical protein
MYVVGERERERDEWKRTEETDDEIDTPQMDGQPPPPPPPN